VEEFLKKRPKPEALQKAVALNREAEKCYDKAVALAPQEPETHMQRALFKMSSCMENIFIQYFRDGSTFDTKKPLSHFLFTKNAVADLKEAARLSPRNVELIALAALSEWLTDMVAQSNFEKMSDDTTRSMLDAITRLEKLAQDKETKVAAEAYRNLGILKIVYGNMKTASYQAAEPCFRQAVVLQPSDEGSWNLLLASMLDSGSPDEIAEVCERRLKAANTAYNHLLVAKAATKRNNWERAAREAGLAFAMETNGVVAPLMLAALSIRRGEQTDMLGQAVLYLRATRERIQSMAVTEERDRRLAELMLNAALFQALSGKIIEARDLVDTVLKHDPDNNEARQIKAALPDN
jgi:tetratricopeptide (TPR) repeat protein